MLGVRSVFSQFLITVDEKGQPIQEFTVQEASPITVESILKAQEEKDFPTLDIQFPITQPQNADPSKCLIEELSLPKSPQYKIARVENKLLIMVNLPGVVSCYLQKLNVKRSHKTKSLVMSLEENSSFQQIALN